MKEKWIQTAPLLIKINRQANKKLSVLSRSGTPHISCKLGPRVGRASSRRHASRGSGSLHPMREGSDATMRPTVPDPRDPAQEGFGAAMCPEDLSLANDLGSCHVAWGSGHHCHTQRISCGRHAARFTCYQGAPACYRGTEQTSRQTTS
jgi:hypothetical protein